MCILKIYVYILLKLIVFTIGFSIMVYINYFNHRIVFEKTCNSFKNLQTSYIIRQLLTLLQMLSFATGCSTGSHWPSNITATKQFHLTKTTLNLFTNFNINSQRQLSANSEDMTLSPNNSVVRLWFWRLRFRLIFAK